MQPQGHSPNSPVAVSASTPLAQPVSSSLSLRSRPITWFERKLQHLSMRQKIGLGYGIALGVAIVGTTVGFVIGNRLQHQALQNNQTAHEQGHTVRALQNSVLQARTHQQQFIPLLTDPAALQEEYDHFQDHVEELKIHFQELQTLATESGSSDLQAFLNLYSTTPTDYEQEVTALIQQIRPSTLPPAQIPAAQQLLLTFTNGETALRLDQLSDNLTQFVQVAEEQEEASLASLAETEQLRIQIVTLSILLSVILAILLVIYTSRAIARPLETVTTVAKRVTQESNFDLRANVSSQDEVRTLADAFNQLIERVQQLLEEQKVAMARERQMQENQLIQTEKMSSLGRMMAGVAHEINNPINFIYGNLTHAEEYIHDLLGLIEIYQETLPNSPAAVADYAEEIDFEFTKDDLPKMLQSMKVGADRVRQIVLSLKNFSRLDDVEVQEVDLHACLDNTLLILNNRIKKGVTIERQYGNIPAIEGFSGSLYQVFMNLLSNALDALDEAPEPSERDPVITITTSRVNSNWVSVRIADSGPGISPEAQEKIFELFFTTKPQGIGTGMGLAISRDIVEKKHGGQIMCTSEINVGTTFSVLLPIHQSAQVASEKQVPVLAGNHSEPVSG